MKSTPLTSYTMSVSRRQMLKLGAGATAMCVAGAQLPLRAAAATQGKIPIGLGLNSLVHGQWQLPELLKAVAGMGYEAVALAHHTLLGLNTDAPTWKKLLDQNGLKCCGQHVALNEDLEGDYLQPMVERCKLLGTPYLIIRGVPRQTLSSVAGILETTKRFNAISANLKPHGMKLGYLCHNEDFAKIEGSKTVWEVIGENTSPDFVMQLDTGNCAASHADPVAMLKKFPGRAQTVVLNGVKPGVVVGEGEARDALGRLWHDHVAALHRQLAPRLGGDHIGPSRLAVIEKVGIRPLALIEACRAVACLLG